MKSVDPALLSGYTIEFFTSVSSAHSRTAQSIEDIGNERGIDVLVNRHSIVRETLLEKLCSSKGIIHYAKVSHVLRRTVIA